MTSDDPFNMSGVPSQKPPPDPTKPEPGNDPKQDGHLTVGDAIMGVAALGLAAVVAAEEAKRQAKKDRDSCLGVLFGILIVIGLISSACDGPDEEPAPSRTSTYGTR
ncbi:hypothetical protein ACFYZ4_18200 [Streptomyces sp. NPDC001513]|uniref:hypothetical protein n=1 Tax=Streptomyces sp. NPDC001513 TaxID=3364580 RepID=UPI00369A33D3